MPGPAAAVAAGAAGTAADAAALLALERERAAADRALFEPLGAAPERQAGPALPADDAAAAAWLDALRARIAPAGALLIYRHAEPATRLWALTREGWWTFDLPSGAAIESKADTLRTMLRRRDLATSEPALRAARRLYMMLISSAEPVLRGKRDLTIVAGGPLALLPFETLLTREPEKAGTPKTGWLVERWTVTYATSAEAGAQPEGAPLLGGVLALGDPLFGPPEEGGVPIAPLPKSAIELAMLDQQARARERVALVGAEASRARLLSEPLLADAGVIHLATHAEARDADPERSGLWLAAGDDGAPAYLTVEDVLALDLRARVVALTQCETRDGGTASGAGLRALSGAFLRAGAEHVVMSTWKPLERASAVLIDRFYRDLLRRDRPVAEALAEAKRQMIKRAETRSPFLWAPLVVIEGPHSAQ